MNNLRIIFLGTPDFAAASLDALIETGFNVVAVITSADKPAGRGQKLRESAVKIRAQNAGLPLLQPTNLKSLEFQDELRSYNADLQIVVAFRMLPEVVWNMPRLGTFNLHASLLPQYRGAAPINWAIINGEKETGITTFFIQHQIDTGDVLLQEKVAISIDQDAGELHDVLMKKGAQLVVKTVETIQSGSYEPEKQEAPLDIKSAPKIFKETCKVDWNKSMDEIYNHIRGLSPYPGAWTVLPTGQQLKVFRAIKNEKVIECGLIETDGKTYLIIGCNNGSIQLQEVQLQGKKRMNVNEFLRGFTFNTNSKLL